LGTDFSSAVLHPKRSVLLPNTHTQAHSLKKTKQVYFSTKI